jgi:protein-tyrosine-phosphatase
LGPDIERRPLWQVGDLAEEFRGVFSQDTIDRYVRESLDAFDDASLQDYLPVLVHGYTRERLRALGQAEGRIPKEVPEVLFVCVEGAARGQMAAALLMKRAGDRLHVRSSGSVPGLLDPTVEDALAEVGIEFVGVVPMPLSDEVVRAADVIVTMGRGHTCPFYAGKRYLGWPVDDPAGCPLDEVRRIRDGIDRRVQELLRELVE